MMSIPVKEEDGSLKTSLFTVSPFKEDAAIKTVTYDFKTKETIEDNFKDDDELNEWMRHHQETVTKKIYIFRGPIRSKSTDKAII